MNNNKENNKKNIFEDATIFAGKLMENLADENDVIFGDFIEPSEHPDESRPRKYKRATIKKSLWLEFTLSLLLGYIGIPELFRRNKTYGIVKFLMAAVAIVTISQVSRAWPIIIPVAFLYALDLGFSISRLVIFYKSKRFAKRFLSDYNGEIAKHA